MKEETRGSRNGGRLRSPRSISQRASLSQPQKRLDPFFSSESDDDDSSKTSGLVRLVDETLAKLGGGGV